MWVNKKFHPFLSIRRFKNKRVKTVPKVVNKRKIKMMDTLQKLKGNSINNILTLMINNNKIQTFTHDNSIMISTTTVMGNTTSGGNKMSIIIIDNLRGITSRHSKGMITITMMIIKDIMTCSSKVTLKDLINRTKEKFDKSNPSNNLNKSPKTINKHLVINFKEFNTFKENLFTPSTTILIQ